MSIVLQTPSNGSVTIAEQDTASNVTVTVPARTANVMLDGPAFSAYAGTNQTVNSASWTKLNISTEEFDTANCFDSTTNYRFTPTVAGYYQFNGSVQFAATVDTAIARSAIYKNGTAIKYGAQIHASTNKIISSVVAAVVFCNGSTDYIELYAYQDTGSPQTAQGVADGTYFQAFLARGA